MSKAPKNYEKILIGVAGVAALGCAALGFFKLSGADSDFTFAASGSGKNDASIPEATETSKAVSSLQGRPTFKQAVTGTDRPVDLFTGVPLFANKNDPNTPVDPITSPEVHPPIPNTWWLKYGVDMTYANSPARDFDGDGFSNLEEYEAKTNPADPADFPALVDKLVYLQDESTMWYVQFGLESEGKWAPKFRGATHDKKNLANRVSATEMLEVGNEFFASGDFAKRFKFTGFTEKEVTSERTQDTRTVRIANFEDLKPNKKGTKYQSQYGLPDAELNSKAYYDRTAIVELNAAGSQGKQFKVEEGTTFALPSTAAEKNYKMKKITPEAIEVEYTGKDGTVQTLEIKKGGTH